MNKVMQKQYEDQLKKQSRITDSHSRLLVTLAQLEMDQKALDDPEMMSSRVDAAIQEFFIEIEYPDIVSFLRLINTAY